MEGRVHASEAKNTAYVLSTIFYLTLYSLPHLPKLKKTNWNINSKEFRLCNKVSCVAFCIKPFPWKEYLIETIFN